MSGLAPKGAGTRTGGAPFLPRLYGALLRRLAPSLGERSCAEAAGTFGALWREAKGEGVASRAAFLAREARALLATAREEREDRARRRGAAGTGSPPGPPERPQGGRLATAAADYLRWELRLALRNLARSPGFVAVSLLSLTFGIGGSTLLFTLANAVLFRPPAHVADPDALVHIVSTHRGRGHGPASYPDFEDYRAGLASVEDLVAFRNANAVVATTSDDSRILRGLEVSENWFDLLGIPLARGRGFLPEDVDAGGAVAVIGWALWHGDYGGDPGILGRTLRVDGKLHTIVGVGPRGMTGLDDPSVLEVAVPVMEAREERGHQSLRVVARLREGASLPQLQSELDALAAHMVEEHPDSWDHYGDDPRGLKALTPLQARMPEGVPLAAIAGAFLAVVALLLLIACSNVANLLLSRGLSRRTEVAVRSAIGAPRRRLLVQFLTENLLLFGAAGGLGLFLAWALTRVALSGWPGLAVPGINLAVDPRVAAFALGLSLLTGLTFGLLPALQASRADLVPALKGSTEGRRVRRSSLRSLLVGAQVGGSLVMVLVTLLLVQGLSHARTVDPGFEPRGVAILSVDLSHGGYGEAEGRSLLAALAERLGSVPGVERVALGTFIPLQGGGTYYGGLEPEGYEAGPGEHVQAAFAAASPGYLDVVGMRLARGRDFGAEDEAGGVPVALVNQAFVERYWPGRDGVGQRIGMSGGERSVTVVGVVKDFLYGSVGEDPRPHLWLPFAQAYQSAVIVHVRASGDPRVLLPLLRRELQALDPELPVQRVDLMENVTANATAPQRILSRVLGVTGVLAMALAMLGIYGVIGYSVSRRTREVGLRIALGAHPGTVVGMVVREGVALSLVGVIPGLLLGTGAAFLMRSILMGISPVSPLAMAGGVGLLVAAAATASLLPALRAARADPMESLRVE